MTNKRYREGLLAHADDARQSRELARIRTDVPVEFDAESAALPGRVARALFRALHPARIPDARHGVRAGRPDDRQGLRARAHESTEVRELAQALTDGRALRLRAAARRSRPRCAPESPAWRFRPATARALRAARSSVDRTRRPVRRIARGGRPRTSPHVDVIDALAELKAVLEDESIAKVGHDLKFDAIVLERHGVALRGIETDTMLASYLLDATRSAHPLEDLAIEHAGYKALREEDLCGRGAKAIPFAQIPLGDRARLRGRTGRPRAAALRRRFGHCCGRRSSRRSTATWSCRSFPSSSRSSGRASGWTARRSLAQSQHVERELASSERADFRAAG